MYIHTCKKISQEKIFNILTAVIFGDGVKGDTYPDIIFFCIYKISYNENIIKINKYFCKILIEQ